MNLFGDTHENLAARFIRVALPHKTLFALLVFYQVRFFSGWADLSICASDLSSDRFPVDSLTREMG